MKSGLALAVWFLGLAGAAMAAPKGDECNPAKNPGRFPNVTFEEVKKAAADHSATFLDANTKDTYAEGHVTDAIHYYSASRDLLRRLPKDKSSLIVAYCGGPKCTAWYKAAQAACEMGYTNVKHYKDGIEGWKAQKAL